MNRTLLTAAQVRQALPISKDLLYDLAASGEIDHYRIRGRLFFEPEAVERFLRARHHAARRNHFKMRNKGGER